MKIDKMDWALFKQQKEYLIAMANEDERLTAEIAVLDGVINMMDAIQDDFSPLGDEVEVPEELV